MKVYVHKDGTMKPNSKKPSKPKQVKDERWNLLLDVIKEIAQNQNVYSISLIVPICKLALEIEKYEKA